MVNNIMKTISSKILIPLLILGILNFIGCNKSNPTDSGDNIQYKIHTWEKVMNGLPTNASYNISSVESKIYAYSGFNLYSSSDNGDSWSSLSGFLDSTQVNAIAGMNNFLIAGTNGKGIFI